jgi:hypothetical protein
MTLVSISRRVPGKKKTACFGLRESAALSKDRHRLGVRQVALSSVARAEAPDFAPALYAKSSPEPATLRFLLLPPCFPDFRAS